ncbi:hypothetical protein Vafri_17710 [Volvox africanus]|uniref:Zinc finger C3HC4 RING-type domain-containing protein n=2 Tax=Volvox africanus TaxID=51714 RepID=A0A8J4F7Y2_9CHLO|nr:hypothetical protein Vafri_17710 [Volvox africanus]
MTACVKNIVIDHELAAIRLQEQELQSRRDALLAERLAIAFSLGVDTENEEEIGSIMVQMGLEVPGLSDIRQLESQLQELRATAGNLLAKSLHESILEQEEASRLSEEAAKALRAQERWRASIARHDAAFAWKLASVDEDTWWESGDILEEPFELPMPAGVPYADVPAGPSGSQPQKQTPTGRSTATTACGPTTTQPPRSSVSSGPGPSGGPGPSTGAPGPSKALRSASANEGRQPQHATGPTGPTRGSVQCLSCFDTFAGHAVTCAGADAPSSSTATAGCKHYFCSGCLTEYMRGMVRDRKFPINCPMAAGGAAGQQGCKLKFSREAVMVALEGHPKEIQVPRQGHGVAAKCRQTSLGNSRISVMIRD